LRRENRRFDAPTSYARPRDDGHDRYEAFAARARKKLQTTGEKDRRD
jgi:hypothetical protein